MYEFGGIFLRKLGIILIIFLFISPEIQDEEIYELEDISAIITDNSLTTEEWTVTLKENISNKKVQKYLTKLKKDHLMELTEHKNVKKYVINSSDGTKEIDISYEIIIPHDQNHSPELVATIKGTQLSETVIEEYKSKLKYIRNQFFTKKSRLFTCLITLKDGMIASDDFSKKMSNKLDLKYVSTQKDMINEISYQETIYGYTTLWNNELLIENKPLNIQVVIQRHKNGKQKVIIGTPILIAEY